jgi:hypothetical protein
MVSDWDEGKLTRRRICNKIRWWKDKAGVVYGETQLTKGKTMLFDAEDLPMVKSLTWCTRIAGRTNIYAVCTSLKNPPKNFHSRITGYAFVDHINKDSLDNRKVNLRSSNHVLNARNQIKSRKNTTGITGIYLINYTSRSGSFHWAWQAKCIVNGKQCAKRFSVDKYGPELAKTLAIKARQKMEETYGFTND